MDYLAGSWCIIWSNKGSYRWTLVISSETAEKFTARFEYEQNVFTDINSIEWFADKVKKCYEFGLMKGKRKGILMQGNVAKMLNS